MTKNDGHPDFRQLSADEIDRLEHRGCTASDWHAVTVTSDFDVLTCRNTRFIGDIRLGGVAAIENSTLVNCSVADDATVDNVARIEGWHGHPVSACVLDETGSHSVPLSPGLTCREVYAASIIRDPDIIGTLTARSACRPTFDIGHGATVADCGRLTGIIIGAGATIIGALRLSDGIAAPGAEIGSGVIAERFFIDGGACVTDGFTLHDSVVMANSRCSCGEAVASIIGPYAVTMHKSTLLIGGSFPFFNAGSGTNQSNHRYKLGPLHYGIMDRGCRTASDSYIMWPASIGAFTTVIGKVTTSPDTRDFPFSYLIGNPDGTTTLLPGAALRSIGRVRDEQKWPGRSRRQGEFATDSLNPYTFHRMMRGMKALGRGQSQFPGFDIKAGWHERGAQLYRMAADIYAGRALADRIESGMSVDTTVTPASGWIDAGGQPEPIASCATAEEAAWADVRDYIRLHHRTTESALQAWAQAENDMAAMLLTDIDSELRTAGLQDHPLRNSVTAAAETACTRANAIIQKHSTTDNSFHS